MSSDQGLTGPARGTRDGIAGEHEPAAPQKGGPDPASRREQAGRRVALPAVVGLGSGGLVWFSLEVAQRSLYDLTLPSPPTASILGVVIGVVAWGLRRIDKNVDHRHRLEAAETKHRHEMEDKEVTHRQQLEERRLESTLEHIREQDLRETFEMKERAMRQSLKEGSSHLDSGRGFLIERRADGTSRTSIQPPDPHTTPMPSEQPDPSASTDLRALPARGDDDNTA
jgi:hypothetical protein